MVKRRYWINRIERGWERRSLIWLSGVRRVGKTFLCKSLDNVEYFDCELPGVRHRMEDPESFLRSLKGKVIFDEIHRLFNPAELLKIAVDHLPNLKIVATGSATLQTSAKFRDALTGRKEEIHLTPMISEDLEDFGNTNLRHRFLHGGLPPFFLSQSVPERDFQEWMDSYWAKDIQELFRLERRYAFQKLLELLFVNSGGLFEATRYARPCEISRATVSNYLAVLEHTSAVYIVRPFSTHRPTEIISAPKVYAFDTGFVCYYRGWQSLQPENLGILWEHYLLNEIIARTQNRNIFYWRDKQGHEIDFILIPHRGQPPITIECKWSSGNYEEKNLKVFRKKYPEGENWVVCQDIRELYPRKVNGLQINFLNLAGLVTRLEETSRRR